MPVLKLAQLSPAPRSAFTTSRCATASKLSAWFCHHSRNWKSRKLDELGISRIEAGFPKVSPEDGEAITLMRKADLKAELWGFSRAVRGDVEELVRLGLSATVIESPTSDIKLRAYGLSRESNRIPRSWSTPAGESCWGKRAGWTVLI